MTSEQELIFGEISGHRAAFIVPTIPERAPPYIREVLSRRRIATVTGRCPCGAARPRLPRRVRRAIVRTWDPPVLPRVEIQHEDGCPAIDIEAVAAWERDERESA